MTRHLSHQESFYSIGSYANATALKAVDVSALPNNTWAYVETYGEYYLDKNTYTAESLPAIIAPNTGFWGRWIKKKITSPSDYNIVKVISGIQSSSTSVQDQLNNKLNLSGGTLTGSLILNENPTSSLQAATKQYVDNLVQGLDVKGSVRAATTESISLSGIQTIDGVVLVANNRVLVKNQSTASQDGIYVVLSGTWARSTDFDSWSKIPGGFAFVEEGTVNNATGWVCSSDQGGTIGTTSIVFVPFSSAGTYTADGQGLELSGNQFSLEIGNSTLSKSSSGLKVATGGITNTEIASGAAIERAKIALGTGSHIIVNDGPGNLSSIATLDIARGGTGLTTLGGANQVLGVNAGGTALEYKTISSGSGSGTVDYCYHYSIPGSIHTGAIADIGTNGSGFTTSMGFPIPANMAIAEIAICFGTYAADAASTLPVLIRELSTSGAGVGTAITSSAGTLKHTVTFSTVASSGVTYHRTISVTGLNVGLTAGNLLFVAIGSVNFATATDMALIIRCKQ